jgi:hypothetical protein
MLRLSPKAPFALMFVMTVGACHGDSSQVEGYRQELSQAFDGGADSGSASAVSDAGQIVIPDELLDTEGTTGTLGEPDYGAVTGEAAQEIAEAIAESGATLESDGEAASAVKHLRSRKIAGGPMPAAVVVFPIPPQIPLFSYTWEIHTCRGSAAPAANDMLWITLQSDKKGARWPLNNAGVDRRSDRTDTYAFAWPSIGPPSKLQSIKFEHRGNAWCVDSIKLKYLGQELWHWNEKVPTTRCGLRAAASANRRAHTGRQRTVRPFQQPDCALDEGRTHVSNMARLVCRDRRNGWVRDGHRPYARSCS